MRYLIITYDGTALPIAYKLKQEGNEVYVFQVENEKDTLIEGEKYMPEPQKKKDLRLKLYKGIIDKITFSEAIELCKFFKLGEIFIFFDDNSTYKYAEILKEYNHHGIYPSKTERMLEINRKLAKDFVNRYYEFISKEIIAEFHNVKEAISFIKKYNIQFVVKPLTDELQTFVPETDDLNETISYLESNKEYEKVGFILENKINKPVEFAPQIVFYDGKPIYTNICIENKKIGAGNVGYTTGCSQDFIYNTPLTSPMNLIAFPDVIFQIAKQKRGMFIFDAGLIIDRNNNKVYFTEFCPNRIGVNAFFTEISQLSSITEYFEKIVRGENPFTAGVCSASIRLFRMEPEDEDVYRKEKITYNSLYDKHIYFWNIYKEDKVLYTGGTDIAAVADKIDNFNDIFKLERIIETIKYPNKYYRPAFDFISYDYETSIPNRFNYLRDLKLI